MNRLYDNLWIAAAVAWHSLPYQAGLALALGGTMWTFEHGQPAVAAGAVLAGMLLILTVTDN